MGGVQHRHFLPQACQPLSFPSTASNAAPNPRKVPEIRRCSSGTLSFFSHLLQLFLSRILAPGKAIGLYQGSREALSFFTRSVVLINRAGGGRGIWVRFHHHLGGIKPWWHPRSTWSPRLSQFWRLGRHGRKAKLSPQISFGEEKLTLSVSPSILCALVTFDVKTGVCQLFMSQKQGIFSPRIASAASLARLGEDAGFS